MQSNASDTAAEEALEAALRADPRTFVELLHADHQLQLLGWIKRHSWGVLDGRELLDAYQESIMAIWTKVRAPEFDPARPLRIVRTICRNVAVTMRRKKLVRGTQVAESIIDEQWAATLSNTPLGDDWALRREEDRREFLQLLRAIIFRLPKRQRAAMLALADCFEQVQERNKYSLLAESMSEITGQSESPQAAKSALRFGIEKVRSELAKRGYGFLEGQRHE